MKLLIGLYDAVSNIFVLVVYAAIGVILNYITFVQTTETTPFLQTGFWFRWLLLLFMFAITVYLVRGVENLGVPSLQLLPLNRDKIIVLLIAHFSKRELVNFISALNPFKYLWVTIRRDKKKRLSWKEGIQAIQAKYENFEQHPELLAKYVEIQQGRNNPSSLWINRFRVVVLIAILVVVAGAITDNNAFAVEAKTIVVIVGFDLI